MGLSPIQSSPGGRTDRPESRLLGAGGLWSNRLWGRRNRRGSRSGRRRGGHTRLDVIGVDDGLGDIGGLSGKENGALLLGDIKDQGVAMRLGIIVEHVVHLRSKRAVELLHLVLHVILGIFSRTLELLLFVVDGLGARGAFIVAELVARGLQLLGQAIDFVTQGLELVLLGLVLSLEVGEASLAFVGLRHGYLESNDGNFGRTGRRRSGGCGGIWSGRRLGGGSQGKA